MKNGKAKYFELISSICGDYQIVYILLQAQSNTLALRNMHSWIKSRVKSKYQIYITKSSGAENLTANAYNETPKGIEAAVQSSCRNGLFRCNDVTTNASKT